MLIRAAKEAGVAQQRFARLLGTRAEANAIAELVEKDQLFKALDFDSNYQAALSKELGEYRYLHFATHGLLNSSYPELSGIVLSLIDRNGKPQKGFLKLSDIFNMKLSAELVVLSACQTGLGKEIRGEGLVGLTRGFMYAGARSVLATSWKINDSATAELMSNFYRAMLKENRRPAEALRLAQLSLQQKRRWSNPYYWAGFMLQGEW
jgi:CHAT domain-containing protein